MAGRIRTVASPVVSFRRISERIERWIAEIEATKEECQKVLDRTDREKEHGKAYHVRSNLKDAALYLRKAKE